MLDRMADLVGSMADGMLGFMRCMADRVANLVRSMTDVVTDLGSDMSEFVAKFMAEEIEGTFKRGNIDRDIEIEVDAQTRRDITTKTEVEMAMGHASMRFPTNTDFTGRNAA